MKRQDIALLIRFLGRLCTPEEKEQLERAGERGGSWFGVALLMMTAKAYWRAKWGLRRLERERKRKEKNI